jgi:hypothetical protein
MSGTDPSGYLQKAIGTNANGGTIWLRYIGKDDLSPQGIAQGYDRSGGGSNSSSGGSGGGGGYGSGGGGGTASNGHGSRQGSLGVNFRNSGGGCGTCGKNTRVAEAPAKKKRPPPPPPPGTSAGQYFSDDLYVINGRSVTSSVALASTGRDSDVKARGMALAVTGQSFVNTAGVAGGSKIQGGGGAQMGGWLNNFQTALDIAGLAPVVGIFADGLNVLVSAGRGDWVGMALSATAMMPILGQGVTLAKGLKGCCCFVEGTTVSTEDGQVPIEQLQPGDRVFSKNLETGEVELRPVSKTYITNGKEIYKLVTVAPDGQFETVEVTDNHPYWVVGEGWVDSAELLPGMLLNDKDGEIVGVISLEPQGYEEQTYNIEVAGNHNYFVGEQEVLVHNCTCGIVTKKGYKQRYTDAKGSNIEADAQIHHSYPQKYRKTAEANNYDIDNPLTTFAVKTKPGPNTNVHSKITTEFTRWDKKIRQRFGKAPTHQQILQKKAQMDKKYGQFYDR